MTPKEWNDLRRLALKLTNDEDITQELLFEIIKLNLSFPLAVNYVKLCLRGSAYRLNAKHNGKRKKDALNQKTISINYQPDPDDDMKIEDIIPAPENNELDIKEFLETLTDEETQILTLMIEGYTVREICKILKISSKTHSKIIKSIRQKALEFFT
jgi:RNA polymerase sigma factor (sigma-70 family)